MTTSEFELPDRTIGNSHPPFIIAEMSGNHNGSLERAHAIVDAVADSGADAIKLQTYTADTMTIRSQSPEFTISDPNSLWYGKDLYTLYEEAHTPWEWHAELFEHARKRGLIAFSTPFDATAVDFLMSLKVPLFKIASFENTDIPLIRKVASTGLPMIISAGTASMDEMQTAFSAARKAGCNDLVVLKCTSAYPAPPKEANVRAMATLANTLSVQAGLSDHTLGIATSLTAIALGATVIEKHVTLSRAEGGVDAAFSLEPHELKQLVTQGRQVWESLGSANYAPTESEKASHVFRRSIYVVSPVKKGEPFTTKNLRIIRPALGLPPVMIDEVLGKKATCDIPAGIALKQEHIN